MPILFNNERINLNFDDQTKISFRDDEAINEKYVKGEVRIVTEQARYPLNTIVSIVESGTYDLNPEFQRRHRWDTAKRSRLIESFIMNVPIPPIFLYEDRYSHYEVMDGLQRLSAIYDFYKDRYALEGLQEWKELNGFRYSRLPLQVRRGIDRRYLSSIILLQETAKTGEEALRLKQLVFERINSGGVKLEPQEARNAIYNGPLNQICIRLARDENLCKMWNIPPPTQNEIENHTLSQELVNNKSFRTMEDVELVLRFFAYRQILDFEKGALKEYLDAFLRKGNGFPSELLQKYEQLFTDTSKVVYEVLGERAFMLFRLRGAKWDWYKRPTKVLFDPVMFCFSQNLDSAGKLISKRTQIRSELKGFYKSKYAIFEGRNVNKSDITARNIAFDEFIKLFV